MYAVVRSMTKRKTKAFNNESIIKVSILQKVSAFSIIICDVTVHQFEINMKRVDRVQKTYSKLVNVHSTVRFNN